MCILDIYDHAVEYRNKQRRLTPPTYNEKRLLEQPIPDVAGPNNGSNNEDNDRENNALESQRDDNIHQLDDLPTPYEEHEIEHVQVEDHDIEDIEMAIELDAPDENLATPREEPEIEHVQLENHDTEDIEAAMEPDVPDNANGSVTIIYISNRRAEYFNLSTSKLCCWWTYSINCCSHL